MNTVLVCMWLG